MGGKITLPSSPGPPSFHFISISSFPAVINSLSLSLSSHILISLSYSPFDSSSSSPPSIFLSSSNCLSRTSFPPPFIISFPPFFFLVFAQFITFFIILIPHVILSLYFTFLLSFVLSFLLPPLPLSFFASPSCPPSYFLLLSSLNSFQFLFYNLIPSFLHLSSLPVPYSPLCLSSHPYFLSLKSFSHFFPSHFSSLLHSSLLLTSSRSSSSFFAFLATFSSLFLPSPQFFLRYPFLILVLSSFFLSSFFSHVPLFPSFPSFSFLVLPCVRSSQFFLHYPFLILLLPSSFLHSFIHHLFLLLRLQFHSLSSLYFSTHSLLTTLP